LNEPQLIKKQSKTVLTRSTELLFVYTVFQKNVVPKFCKWLHQLLTDFENSVTVGNRIDIPHCTSMWNI